MSSWRRCIKERGAAAGSVAVDGGTVVREDPKRGIAIGRMDGEKRKRSSAYEDCPVVTAQEKPEGSKQVFRVHLFKLHMAGDPTAQRDLYNRITRMVELVGLKRFEFNAMVVFVGVSDGNLFSVLRRSHVTMYRVKVMDKKVH